MAITSKIYIPPIYDLMTENDLKRRETPHKTPPQGDHTPLEPLGPYLQNDRD